MLASTIVPYLLLVRDVTRDTGIAAYSGATLVCLFVAWRARRRRIPGTGFWMTMGFLNAILACEVPFGFRFRVTKVMRHLFDWLEAGLERRLLQLVVLAIVGILFLVAVLVVLFREETPRSRRFALMGFLLSVLIWCVEAVSLHQTLPILAHRIGPLVFVAWAWVVAAMVTAAGAFVAVRAET